MERAALIGGILLAAAIAIGGSLERVIDINIDGHDWGHRARAAYVAPQAGTMPATTYDETAVRVVHAAAVVRVIAEDRADVSVEIANPGRAPMPTVSEEAGKLIIDGRLARRIDECRTDGGARLDGYGALARSELPQITIRAPRALDLGFRGAVQGDIGAAQSLDFSQSGCGRTLIGDIAERLEIHNSGSGDVRAGAARTAEVHLAGSGEARLGAIAERLDVHIAGSGEVRAESLRGALDVRTAGSGDMALGGGAVSAADIEIAGSGSVDIDAPVASLNVRIAGSGDVSVRQPVGDVDVSVTGSGDVVVAAVTGRLSKSVMGSGDVIVRAPAAPTPAPAAPK